MATFCIEAFYPIPRRPGELIMHKVNGSCTIEAAICDGDFVIICDQKSRDRSEIVWAMIDGEPAVKTSSMKDGHLWLLPANDFFAPISGDDCEILGKVTAILRSVR